MRFNRIARVISGRSETEIFFIERLLNFLDIIPLKRGILVAHLVRGRRLPSWCRLSIWGLSNAPDSVLGLTPSVLIRLPRVMLRPSIGLLVGDNRLRKLIWVALIPGVGLDELRISLVLRGAPVLVLLVWLLLLIRNIALGWDAAGLIRLVLLLSLTWPRIANLVLLAYWLDRFCIPAYSVGLALILLDRRLPRDSIWVRLRHQCLLINN